MTIALALARAAVRDLPPIDIAGAPLPGTIRLDANENPFEALVVGHGPLNRYPEPQPAALRREWPTSMAYRRSACGSRGAATTRSIC